MDVNKAFGRALREIRLRKGITQEGMASAASRIYISALERGLKSPTLARLEVISKVLGVHPLKILELTYKYRDE